MKYELFVNETTTHYVLVENFEHSKFYRDSMYLDEIAHNTDYFLDGQLESTLQYSYTKLLDFDLPDSEDLAYHLKKLLEEQYPERFI